MQHLAPQLEQLGMSDYESRIYAALLEQSPMGAALIAKKCNLSRSTVYTVLAALIAKGFIGTTHRNEVKQFFVEDLSAVRNALDQEVIMIEDRKRALKQLEGSIGNLRGMIRIPQISVFEGQEGLKKIYRSMLRDAGPDEVLCIMRDEFVWRPEWKFIFEQEWHSAVKKMRKEKNISTKLLINASSEEKLHKKYYQGRKNLQVRSLPAKQAMKDFALYVLGDTASILSFEHNHLVGIKITNRTMADNLRSLFEREWESGKSLT